MLLSFSDTKRKTGASILVYKHSPERTGFTMYSKNTQQQLTCLAFLLTLTNLNRFYLSIGNECYTQILSLPN